MDEWIDTAETLAILGASWPKLRRLVNAGELTEYRRPASPRNPVFRRRDVERLVIPQPRRRRSLTPT